MTVDLSPLEAGRMRGLRSLLRGHRRLYAVSVGAIVLRHVALVVGAGSAAIVVGLAVERASGTHRAHLGALVVVALGSVVVAAAAHWIENHASHVLSFEVLADLRVGLLGRLGRTTRTFYGGRRLGELVSAVHDDTERLEVFFAHSSLYAIAAATVSPLTVVAVAGWSPPVAAVLALTLTGCVVLPLLLRHAADRQGAAQRQAAAALATEVGETVGALREVLAFGLVDRQLARIGDAAATDARARRALGTRASAESAVARLVARAGVLASAAILLADLAHGRRDLPEVLGLLGIVIAAPGAVLQLVSVTRHWAGTAAAADRIASVLRDSPVPPPGALELPASGPLPVRWVDVTAGWTSPDGTPVTALHGLDLDVAAGVTTVLTGASGAGKSTALSLLRPGARVVGGSVVVGGVDVAQVSRDAWQRAVAVVPQHARMLSDTLRANLMLAVHPAEHRSDEEIRAALAQVGAEHLLDRMPDGLDTVLRDGGGFSGGERQRLALARALLARPRLLILDEALSHLDPDAEAALWPALAGSGRRTTLLVAHRPSTVARADRTAGLTDGRLAAPAPNPEKNPQEMPE